MKALVHAGTAVLLLAAAILVDSLLMVATGGVRRVDPFLILTIWYAANGGRLGGMMVGGMAGLAQDSVGSAVFGTHYLSKVVVGYLAMHAAARLIPGQVLTHVVLLAGGTAVEAGLLVGVGLMLDQSFSDVTALGVAVAALLNAVIGSAAFMAVEARRRRARSHGPARGR